MYKLNKDRIDYDIRLILLNIFAEKNYCDAKFINNGGMSGARKHAETLSLDELINKTLPTTMDDERDFYDILIRNTNLFECLNVLDPTDIEYYIKDCEYTLNHAIQYTIDSVLMECYDDIDEQEYERLTGDN